MSVYEKAAELIRNARRVTAFTGAGISVESGIPPFRGEDGLWSKYDPGCLDISYFRANPEDAWVVIKEIFYDFFGQARPNAAHKGLAAMEREGLLQAVITQNIDNLHQVAGSREVYEFHGNSQYLICLKCGERYPVANIDLGALPPHCGNCGGLLKPDFVFFGEPIPHDAYLRSLHEAETADVFLVIGTTGEVVPASMIPRVAKQNGAAIIEMNTLESNYTYQITDVFLQDKATTAMTQLLEALGIGLS